MRNLDRLTNCQLLNIQRMQRVFVIIVLLCCKAFICCADDASPAEANAFDTNAMERVLYYMDNLKVLTRSNVGFPLEININNNKKYQDSYA